MGANEEGVVPATPVPVTPGPVTPVPVARRRTGGWWAVGVGGAVAMLSVIGLLAGCVSTAGTGTAGTAGTSGTGTGGNGYGGNGGDANGGIGGNGGAGIGGNGIDGNGIDGSSGGGFFDPAGLAGSGRSTSRTLDLSGVTSVVVGADFVVRLSRGGPARATVTMDDNLTDRIEASVIGDQLRLGIKPGMSVRDATLAAEVTVDQLDQLDASGASRVMLSPAFISPTLSLVVSGASAVTGPIAVGRVVAGVSGTSTLALSGQVQDLRFSAAGASQLPMAELTVRHLDATLSGASDATLAVTDTLAAQVAGVSVLRYRGAPSVLRSRASGMSSIVRYSP